MLGFCAISEAPISDLGDKSVYAAAQVSAFANVSAFASVFYDAYGNIVCFADVVASPNAVYWGYANVNGTAEVSALAQNISSAIAYIDGNATVSAYANSIFSFIGDINATGTVTVTYNRVRTSSADIDGSADVTALGNEIFSANGSINGYAYVVGLGNVTYSGQGMINANATITANGRIIGDEWNNVPYGTETWSDITPSSDVWTAVTPSTDTWVNVAVETLDNGGDYKAFGREEYPEVFNISVDAKTTTLVMNATNNSSFFNYPYDSSSGISNWGSDGSAFVPVNYVENISNSNINTDALWVSYYQNNESRTNDNIYANEPFNGDAYWISLIDVLVGQTTTPSLHNTSQSIAWSDIYVKLIYDELYSVVYTGSKYLTVGRKRNNIYGINSLYTLESVNGTVWNEIPTLSNQGTYYAIASDASNYALGGYDDGGNGQSLFVHSTDGISFTQVSIDDFNYGITKIIWGNNEFVALTSVNTGAILTSPDGITWSLAYTSSPVLRVFTDIIWDGSQYVIVGTSSSFLILATSSDLVSLNVQFILSFNYYAFLPQIVYHDGQYTITTYGYPLFAAGDLYSLTSTDLITWSTHNILNGTNVITSLIYANGQYIAVGNVPVSGQYANLIVTSPDGINWTQQAISQFERTNFQQIIWDGTKYIAVGVMNVEDLYNPAIFTQQSFIATSVDGITWIESSIEPSEPIFNNVASGGSVVVPPQGIAVLCSNVNLYYPDRNLYTSYGLTEDQIDIVMNAAVSPLNITNISDASNLTWIKRSYVLTPYTTTDKLYPSMAQEVWYAINNTNSYIISSPIITYADIFDAQIVSLTSWSGVNLNAPFQNLIPGSVVWNEVNPGTDTWLRQG